MPKKLREIKSYEKAYFHQFKVNGQDVFVKTTKEEYDALALPNAGAPNGPGVWVQSVSEGICMKDGDKEYFGTPPEGAYVRLEGGKILATAVSKHWVMDESEIEVDGTLKSRTEKQLYGDSIL